MSDNVSLLDKLNTDVKELQQLVTNLTLYSCTDSGRLAVLEDFREKLLEHAELSNKIINILSQKVLDLEAAASKPLPTESRLPRKPFSVLQLIQTQIKNLFNRK
jgi:hypothetical protein